ncbi:hypothetical protein A3734_06535 [Sulfitobacter sp. HI0054]|uniref:helix-turn-helix domain-containing protein n=1 Tax=Sulfitobacter sp. HI0054 TaxID=1822238 RepID=UPI0007C3F2CB|nr:helix-turn-helix domain-containing protein [Sulfitobacter sp. HI0054]KZY51013.1 hypothetical protein A3734_06535 [Sulfitobacter sp. HI0054]
MSLDVLTAIWRDPPCKGGDLLCLLAIADNADDTGFAWPSISTIAKKAAMGERGAQKCVKKLAEAGLISIDAGGGRNKTNAYQITTNGIGQNVEHKNPEQNTPNPGSPFTPINPEQTCINPEPAFAKPRTPVHPNSHEPSIEPSVVNKSARDIDRSVLSILSEVQGVHADAAASFVAYRKRHKSKALTETGANRLATHLWEILDRGGDPTDALGMAEERGWASVQPDWYFNAKGQSNERTHQPSRGRTSTFADEIADAARSR